MSSDIVLLAQELLDEQEWELARHLESLLTNNEMDASSLIEEIVPIYTTTCGTRTLEPDPIYRPFMYLVDYADNRRFSNNTRIFILNACWHLEGCLKYLATPPPKFRSTSGPFGELLVELKNAEVLPLKLFGELMKFNKTVYVPAHHPSVLFTPNSEIGRPTFSVLEAALSFFMMRKLSIPLFDLLKDRGVRLNCWKDFDKKWSTWGRKIRGPQIE